VFRFRAALLFVLAIEGCSPAVAPKSVTSSVPVPVEPKHRVVLISIDGLKPEYLVEADARGLKIPALRELMKTGSRADGMESVWPTVTYPAHTTLVTGVRPSKHGIVTNGPFDPFQKNQDGWYWYTEAITAKTLWTAAREKSLTTGNVYWPVTVGASIDWSFPQIWRAKNDEDDRLMRALSTPGLAHEVESQYGTIPAEHRTDTERANASELILRTRRPAFMLVYFTDLDTEQHKSGPFSKESLATLEDIDRDVARVVEATKKADTFAKTAFVVVSDHGFAAIHTYVRPGSILREAGLIDADDSGRVRDYKAAAWKAGGLCGIVMKDPKDEATKKKLDAIFGASIVGIAKVHDGKSIATLGGYPDAAIVLEASSGYTFAAGVVGPVTGPSGDKGTHGFPPEHADMRATLLFAGSGIKPGVKLGLVKMIDVAPTIARLLGVALPDAEGHSIDAVLE